MAASFRNRGAILPAPQSMTGPVAIAGSRSLSGTQCQPVVQVAQGLAASGYALVTGCATGADSAAFSAVPVASVLVLAAFGACGSGACSASAVKAVSRFAAAGGSVQWWAGGGSSVPLPARLAARTRAVVAQASALVVFFGSPASRGSLLAARCAVGQGLPVLAVPVGFAPTRLPGLGAGGWLAQEDTLCGVSVWRWSSAQSALF